MTVINNFRTLVEQLKKNGRKTRVAVVYGIDSHSEEAISAAIKHQFIDVVMVGPKAEVENYPIFKEFPESVQYIDVNNPDEAAKEAVLLIHEEKADVIMKGLINTDNLLKVILNKESGLLPAGTVLSHLAIADIPSYNKLLFFSDAAVIPYPTIEHKQAILNYMIHTCHKFGIVKPKIGLIHFTEKVNERFPNSTEAVTLKKMAIDGEFSDALIDGPLDLSTACDFSCADLKGIASPIQGNADALLLPNIESANIFYKALVLFAKAEMAGVLLGTQCPVVTTSRSDSSKTKFNSIAMACLMVQGLN